MKKILALLCLLPALAQAVETDPTCTPSGGSSGDVIQGLSLKVSGNNTTIGSVVYDSANRSNSTADQTIEGYGTSSVANGMALTVWMHKSNNSGQTGLTGFTAPAPHAITSPSIQAMGYQYRYGNYGVDSGAITVANGGNASSTRIDVTLAPGTTLSGLLEGTYCSANNAACTATLPTSYATDDLLLEVCSTSSSSGTISTPSGWTALKTDTTSGRKLYLFGKIATSGSETAPTWSVSATVSAQDTNDYTLSYTPSTSATFYAVACVKDSTAPTIAQVKAGNCTGDAAAVASVNEAVTGADTTVLGGSLTYPVHDLYAVLSNGAGDSTLATLADECLDAATGKVIINCPTGYTSIDSLSPIVDFNAVVTPDIVAGDIGVCDSTTNKGHALTWTVAGLYSYPPGDPSQQRMSCNFGDASNGYALHADTLAIVVNNSDPIADVTTLVVDLIKDDAMEAVSLGSHCTEPDGDPITVTTSDTGAGVGADTRPNSTSITTGSWTGTPDTAGAGTFTTTCADDAGGSTTYTVDWTVTAMSVVPDCVGGTLSACINVALPAANLLGSFSSRCSNTVPSLTVMSQSPAATTEVDPLSTVNLVVSSGGCGKQRGVQTGLGIGVN